MKTNLDIFAEIIADEDYLLEIRVLAQLKILNLSDTAMREAWMTSLNQSSSEYKRVQLQLDHLVTLEGE